jgi:MoaA/NifB/PqqE/SkfB family radical SAM enzyme
MPKFTAQYYSDNMQRIFRKANILLSPGHLYYDPDWLVLGVNNVCNLHCKMCDVGTGYEESNFYYNLAGAQPLNMPLELIKEIIDQCAKYFPRTKIGYAFTEPIIYPHLVESLEYANSKGLYTTVTTNGSKLPKLAEDLQHAGLNEIFISLDGPSQIHNAIRGNKHSFEWAIEGMEKIAGMKKNFPKMSVFSAITEWNIGHLVDFTESFRSMPLKQLGFMHTNFTNDEMALVHNEKFGTSFPATASNMKGINLEMMNLEKLLEEITTLRERTFPFNVSFSPLITTMEGLRNFYQHPENRIGKICNDAFRTIMIKSDGSVIPAHGRCYKVEAGNLYRQNLEEIWNSATLAQFRKALINEGGLLPACTRCCSAF